MELITNIYYNIINNFNIDNFRYLYSKIDFNDRIIGIIGGRGVGKTTLMLQLIKYKLKNIHQSIYLTMDHIYFLDKTLYDTIKYFYEKEKRRYFFIDEIHKYKNWEQELKNLFDAYNDINIIFSGSSSINIVKGKYDLSRRCILYKLNGLSFREFLNLKYNQDYKSFSYNEIIENYFDISYELLKIDELSENFKEYLLKGNYPIIFEGSKNYYQILVNIIDKIIHEDIISLYSLNTENIPIFRKIIFFLSTMQPSELNPTAIGNAVGSSNKTIAHYIDILKETGLINLVQINKQGAAMIRNYEKPYIENTSLYYAINKESGKEINIGMVREIFFVANILNSGKNLFYSKDIGDFQIENNYFEIGGKNKSKKQILSDLPNSFIVKDDILYPAEKTIPLHLFGFLY